MATLRLRQTDSRRTDRLDSDADVLHFPEGGVFGRPARQREGSPDHAPCRPLRIVHEVESAFDQVQRRLDDLKRQLDGAGEDPWRPSAA